MTSHEVSTHQRPLEYSISRYTILLSVFLAVEIHVVDKTWFGLRDSMTSSLYQPKLTFQMRNPLSAIIQCSDSSIQSLHHMSEISERYSVAEKEITQKEIKACLDALETIISCSLHQKRVRPNIQLSLSGALTFFPGR